MIQENEFLSELELIVIREILEQREEGFNYPFVSVAEVKAFWARKGIECQ